MAELLEVKEVTGLIKIIIKEDCHFDEFLGELVLKLDNKHLYQLSLSIFKTDLNIKKGKLYLFEKDEFLFNLYNNDEELYISRKKFTDENIQESIIDLYYADHFCIASMIHDLSGNTKNIKIYNSKKNIEQFYFAKAEALDLAREILKEVEEELIIGDIYTMLNLLRDEQYNPIISDETITLSLSAEWGIEDLNKNLSQTFYIMLNDTKEKIGIIHYDYSVDVDSDYSVGNVCYEIFEQFRNQGYATGALKLLKQHLHNYEYSGNKDLYFWVSYGNIPSQKVVLKNGGTIVREDAKDGNKIDTGYTYKIKI